MAEEDMEDIRTTITTIKDNPIITINKEPQLMRKKINLIRELSNKNQQDLSGKDQWTSLVEIKKMNLKKSS